jgi:hypothetical protein
MDAGAPVDRSASIDWLGAAVVAQDPKICLLDEPTALDQKLRCWWTVWKHGWQGAPL